MKRPLLHHRALAPFVVSVLVLAAFSFTASAQGRQRAGAFLQKPDEWFRGEEGRRITGNILSWQASAGDWPKNTDTVNKPFTGDRAKLHRTYDNGATTGEIRFLARAFHATKDERCQQAVLKGIDHILAAQYPTGGWPRNDTKADSCAAAADPGALYPSARIGPSAGLAVAIQMESVLALTTQCSRLEPLNHVEPPFGVAA
jgi:hypothetical protein